MNKKRMFAKNILYAFSAQLTSLILSLTMSLVIPKLLGKEQYSYWQLFLFYSSYVGFLAFGFNDGLYLKYGGENYDYLNHKFIGSQIKLNIVMQTVIAVLFAFIVLFFVHDPNRYEVILATCIFAILNNLNAYLGYIFQAVNQTKKFSISTMIEKASYLIIVIVLLLFREKEYHFFVWFYVLAKGIALVYTTYQGRKIILSKIVCNIEVWREMLNSMKIGMNLMLANIASMLILGIGRFIIDRVWGLTVFGEFSFALSMCTFFLSFITQVSMVLFPTLRQTTKEGITKFYSACRVALGIGLPIIFILYIPIKVLLGLWLPDYKSSLQILGLLLPLCTYDGKMNMLCNTYFKVLRKEKTLLIVNIVAMLISLMMSIIGAYFVRSIYFIVFGMVLAIAIRSVISEIILAKIMNASVIKDILLESLLVIGYLITIILLGDILSIVIYSVIYLGFIFIKRKSVSAMVKMLRE